MIDVRIALADVFGYMGEVKFDRPTTTGLEVDEQWPVLRAEQVAWVWLAVQQLLGGAAVIDCSPQAAQRGAQKFLVRVGKRGSIVGTRDELLRLRDPIREMRRRDIQVPQAGMKPLKRIRIGRLVRPPEVRPVRGTSRT